MPSPVAQTHGPWHSAGRLLLRRLRLRPVTGSYLALAAVGWATVGILRLLGVL